MNLDRTAPEGPETVATGKRRAARGKAHKSN